MRNSRDENLRENRKKAAKDYKKAVRNSARNAQREIASQLRALKTKDPKAYWNIINRSKHARTTIPHCSDFFNLFNNMGGENEGVNSNCAGDEDPTVLLNNPYLDQLITDGEVTTALNNLKNGKACGLDLIINEFLKKSKEQMLPIFTKLFNIVLVTGFVPNDWTIGLICPIFKNKGNPSDVNNYRGITILSCFGKLFTAVIDNRLTAFLEDSNILGKEQAGFRKKYSTLDHLFTLHGIIDILLSKKKRLYCAFLDYEKAFDKIERAFLWQKLINENIGGRVLNVIRNMYAAAKSCVVSNKECSDFFTSNIGVRQGENLSPVLFSLFLNDMKGFLEDQISGLGTVSEEAYKCGMNEDNVNELMKLFVLLYADDTVIFSETSDSLQTGLTKI